MSREERAVAIAALTFFIFGLWIYLGEGSFVAPWPLNELLVFVVSFFFVLWNFRSGVLPYLFLASAVAGVLGSYVFWETILSVQEFERFFLEYTVVDWARLTSAVFLIAAMGYFSLGYKKWYLKVVILLSAGLYAWGFYLDALHTMLLAFFLLTVTTAVKPMYKPFHLLWVLHFVLFGMKWLTVHFA